MNVEFQVQSDNREAKYFAFNFMMKNTGDALSFMLRLIDDKNNDIEFELGKKKFPIIEFLIGFLAKNKRTAY